MRRLSFAALTCSAVLLAAPGCGVRHTPVTGLVTLDGQPYGDVLVTFIPANPGDASPVGRADESGKFQMGTEKPNNGVKPGKYKVTVAPGPPKDSKATPHPSEGFRKMIEAKKKVEGDKEYRKVEAEATKVNRKVYHPTLYSDPAKTPLEVEVGNDPKEIKLELKSK
jgi:hypothetical protein